jgi:hypothetical protein
MKKISFKQSQGTVKLLALLLELEVVTLDIFTQASLDLEQITVTNNNDYLQMIVDAVKHSG